MKIKICGITNHEDAQVAVAAGADLLGFILYPKSPRYIEPVEIGRIVAEIWQQFPAHHAPADDAGPVPAFVGVFVNEPVARVQAILAETGLDYAQLHGGEQPAYLDALAGRAYKALRPATAEAAADDAVRYARSQPRNGPRLLIDAYDPLEYGGTGKHADWHTAAELARRHPGLLLAGGLTPANVAAAIRMVQPWGVDVASGVERTPGRKDHARLREFIAAARHA